MTKTNNQKYFNPIIIAAVHIEIKFKINSNKKITHHIKLQKAIKINNPQINRQDIALIRSHQLIALTNYIKKVNKKYNQELTVINQLK